MHAPISRLGLLPLAVSVPLMSMRSGALPNVNSIAQPQKINNRRSARIRKLPAPAAVSRGFAMVVSGAAAKRRSGNKATSAGKVSAAVR